MKLLPRGGGRLDDAAPDRPAGYAQVRLTMTRKTMSKMALVLGVLCLVAMVIVFVFADGLRRWYSGIFFAVIGTVMLVNAVRWRRVTDK